MMSTILPAPSGLYQNQLSPDEIVLQCRLLFGLSEAEVMSHKKQTELVVCRAFIAYFMRRHSNLSYKKIGKYISRDHSNVIHILNLIDVYRGMDKLWGQYYTELYNKFDGKKPTYICPTCGHVKIHNP